MRFPGFEGEWERYKVSDLLDFFPTNSLSWGQLNYELGNLLNLHYGLIHKWSSIHIDLDNHKLPYINSEFEPKTYSLCKNGDVVFADASEDTNDVAKAIEFYDCKGRKVISGLHTIHGRDKLGKTVVGFKGYTFKSSAFRRQIRQLAQGTKVFSINQKNFNECFIGIPSKDEQNKVTNFMRLIDERIQTQMKIIEELEKLIKGLYFVVFTAKNELYPMEKLGKVCNIKKGQQINNSELLETGKYYVMNGGITPSGYHSEYNTENNTISISEGGNSCGYVQYNTEKFWSGGHCYTLNIITEKVTTKYLYHYLKSCESYSTPI